MYDRKIEKNSYNNYKLLLKEINLQIIGKLLNEIQLIICLVSLSFW